MKQSRVYFFALLLLLASGLVFTGCARKSGCAAIENTTKPRIKKNGKAKGKASSNLFDKKTRKKMGGV
ncbi:MAG: hypothetical protein AAFZ52_05240 [Bacteroidota bacterium]